MGKSNKSANRTHQNHCELLKTKGKIKKIFLPWKNKKTGFVLNMIHNKKYWIYKGLVFINFSWLFYCSRNYTFANSWSNTEEQTSTPPLEHIGNITGHPYTLFSTTELLLVKKHFANNSHQYFSIDNKTFHKFQSCKSKFHTSHKTNFISQTNFYIKNDKLYHSKNKKS